jgi:mycofactocin biosynthesis protein MftB
MDPQRAYRLHEMVALRPEPFGALAYHYGNRKLVFLRTPLMVTLVKSLEQHGSVAAALDAAGIPAGKHANYVDALASLQRSDIISEVVAS